MSELPKCPHKCHTVGLNPWVEACPICGCPNKGYNKNVKVPQTLDEILDWHRESAASPCKSCGHARERHEEEPPYPCYDCDCETFSHVATPPAGMTAEESENILRFVSRTMRSANWNRLADDLDRAAAHLRGDAAPPAGMTAEQIAVELCADLVNTDPLLYCPATVRKITQRIEAYTAQLCGEVTRLRSALEPDDGPSQEKK